MASEAVQKILAAEAEADKKTAEARRASEEIINEAERMAAIAIQKKINEAITAADKIRTLNSEKLAEYEKKAEADCSEQINDIRKKAELNSDKAAEAIINSFFS